MEAPWEQVLEKPTSAWQVTSQEGSLGLGHSHPLGRRWAPWSTKEVSLPQGATGTLF